MQPIEPTEGLPGVRVAFAEDQPEYTTLPVMYESENQGRATSTWSLDEDERRAVAEGANIKLTMLTFGNPLQPVVMVVEGVRPAAEREGNG